MQDGLARGETLEAVRLSVAGSAEASARVSGVFEAVLGRAPEGANAAWMGDALARGGSVSELRAGLAYSAEATGAVRGVYLQTLGRDADAAGLAHWQERLAGGLSLAEVRAALASSAEAVARVSPPSVESPAPGGGSAPPGPAAETAPASGGATDAGSGVEPGAAAPGDTGGVSGAGLAGAAAGFARTGATLATPLIESATGGGLTSALTSTLVGAGVVVGAGAAATGVYLATRGEVGVVPVDGYDGTTPGTAPISAEVNGVRGTVLLYRGATTDTPDLAGQRTVTLGVDADGATLRDARGVAVGRLEDGRVVPGEGVSVPDLLRDPAVSTPPLGAGLGEPVDGIVPTPTGGPTGGDGAARPGDGASATPQGGTGSAEVSGGGDPAVPGYGIPTDDDREDVLVLSMWAQGAGKEATETALENLRLGRAMTTDGGGAGGPPGDATAVGGSGQGGTAVGLGPDGDDRGDAGSASATDAAKPSAAPEAQATTGTERTAQVGRNEATWTVDAQGRPIGVEATLREVTSGAQRGSAELKAQTTVKALGLPDDDAGHVVGHRFMLDQGLSNLFPQNANLNRGAYKTFENEVADWIKAGGEVHFTANLSAGSADRPDTIRVSYEVLNPATGRTVYEKVVEFDNKEGQEFDRVPSRDMADYFR